MSGFTRSFDTTSCGEDGKIGPSVTVEEAVGMARAFEEMGVAMIEAGYPARSPHESDIVKAVAATVRSCEVAALASCNLGEAVAAVEAVKYAVRPVVHICLPARETVDPAVRTVVCRRIREAVSTVQAARIPVQFSIDQIVEMERPFRRQCIDVAIEAGARRIGMPDNPATMVRDIAGFVGPRVTISTCSHVPATGVIAAPASTVIQDWRCRVEVAAL